MIKESLYWDSLVKRRIMSEKLSYLPRKKKYKGKHRKPKRVKQIIHNHEHSHSPDVQDEVMSGILAALSENIVREGVQRVRKGSLKNRRVSELEKITQIQGQIMDIAVRLDESLTTTEKNLVAHEIAEEYADLSESLPKRYVERRVKEITHKDEHVNGDCCGHTPAKKGIVTRIKGMGPAIICALDCYGPAIMHATGQFLDTLSGGGHAESEHHHEDPAKILPPPTRIIRQLPRRKEEEELALGRTTITFPVDTGLSRREKMDIPEKLQSYFPETLVEEQIIDDSERSLTWLDRQSFKLFRPLLRKEKKQKPKMKQRTRRLVAAAASLAVLGGIAGGVAKLSLDSQDHEKVQPESPDSLPNYDSGKKKESKSNSPEKEKQPITQSITVIAGDTQWGIAENIISTAGYEPSAAAVNIVTDIIATENLKTNPHPENINSGNELKVPTKEVVTVIFDALERPNKNTSVESQQFVNDLHLLNNLPEMSKKQVMATHQPVFDRIETYLKINAA